MIHGGREEITVIFHDGPVTRESRLGGKNPPSPPFNKKGGDLKAFSILIKSGYRD